MIMPEIGKEGQEKLLASKVLVVGAGGLGSSALYYLAAAGVGTLGIADSDKVGMTNLHRQILHFTEDVGRSKTASAEDKLGRLNPDVQIKTINLRVDASNISGLIRGYDFIIDGTDNFDTKFLINDACVKAKKAFSHGGILRFEGQSFTFVPGSACYRCVFKEPPPPGSCPTCVEAGVLGTVAGLIGLVQATEAIKFIIKAGELLTDRLLTFDSLSMVFRTVPISRNLHCPVCGK
jgi:adenylyltransferase/sulfurtransferase